VSICRSTQWKISITVRQIKSKNVITANKKQMNNLKAGYGRETQILRQIGDERRHLVYKEVETHFFLSFNVSLCISLFFSLSVCLYFFLSFLFLSFPSIFNMIQFLHRKHKPYAISDNLDSCSRCSPLPSSFWKTINNDLKPWMHDRNNFCTVLHLLPSQLAFVAVSQKLGLFYSESS